MSIRTVMLCPGCGNEIPDAQQCPICATGRQLKRRPRRLDKTRLCLRCGNELRGEGKCGVCAAGRAAKKREVEPKGEVCPRCQDSLEDQVWEDVPVRSCPTCRGTFFPLGGLEAVLNKVRETRGSIDKATLREEFKDRFVRKLPEAFRYKKCPICRIVMTRRNYGQVSGILLDHCGKHGVWVDETAFCTLTDFVVRGGDEIVKNVKRRQ